jgi:hypothetical protein
MDLSPSWEAASCTPIQEFPNVLCNPGRLSCDFYPSSGSSPEPAQSSPYHAVLPLLTILILSTDLRLGPSSVLFPSGFPTKFLYATCYMPCTCHPHWLDHSNYAWRRVEVMKRPWYTETTFQYDSHRQTWFISSPATHTIVRVLV